MFSDHYNKLYQDVKNIKSRQSFNHCISKILSNIELDLQDGYTLLVESLSNDKKENKLLSVIQKKRKEKYNNRLNLIVPQYQTSVCVNNCLYCGFHKSNKKIIRCRLNDDEFISECNLLFEWGYRCLELVFSSDPYFTVEKIAKRIRTAKNLASNLNLKIKLGINAKSFSENEYKILVNSGIDFLVQWVETYSDNYYKWHPGNTEKSDFHYRINTLERAINAGIKNIGIGVLLGLEEWIDDVLMLIAHGLYLKKKYNCSPHIIGIPRIKSSNGINEKDFENIPNDKTFKLICNIYKAIFPNTMLFVNTREDLKTNLSIINGGGDLFTIDCATYPGAFFHPENTSDNYEQFRTNYYKRDIILKDLTNNGFTPLYYWK